MSIIFWLCMALYGQATPTVSSAGFKIRLPCSTQVVITSSAKKDFADDWGMSSLSEHTFRELIDSTLKEVFRKKYPEARFIHSNSECIDSPHAAKMIRANNEYDALNVKEGEDNGLKSIDIYIPPADSGDSLLVIIQNFQFAISRDITMGRQYINGPAGPMYSGQGYNFEKKGVSLVFETAIVSPSSGKVIHAYRRRVVSRSIVPFFETITKRNWISVINSASKTSLNLAKEVIPTESARHIAIE